MFKKFLAGLAIVFLFSHIGLSLFRVILWGYNVLITWTLNVRTPYEHIWGPASNDDQQIAICWLGFIAFFGFWNWFAVWWFSESRLTHWKPVLFLTFLTAVWSWVVFSSYLPVLPLFVLSCVFWVVICVILWANVIGNRWNIPSFRRASDWIHEKGLWWWKNVVRPSLWIPFCGLLIWPAVILIVWMLCHLAPAGWYEWIFNATEWPSDTVWHLLLRPVGLMLWRSILSPLLTYLTR